MSDSGATRRSPNVILPDACRCAEVLAERAFRNAASYREFTMSGLCQRCQDLARMGFTAGDDGVPRQQYFLRRGLVFAHSPERAECALIPFVFGAPGSHGGA